MEEEALIQYLELKAGDLALFRGLLRMFGEAFEDAANYRQSPPSDHYLARLLEREHIVPLAAVDAGHVVGGLVAYVLDKCEQDRREIYIYDLAVIESHRRRGIATRLITMLGDIAMRRGAYVIFVQADIEDAPAIALYDKLGVKTTAHHFDIPVPQRRERS